MGTLVRNGLKRQENIQYTNATIESNVMRQSIWPRHLTFEICENEI